MAVCGNSGEQDEHTVHIFVQCTLAKLVWNIIEKAIAFSIGHTYCGESERLVTLPIKFERENIIFMKPVTKNKLIEYSMADLIVLGKRYIYSTRMAATIPTQNTIQHKFTANIKILTLLR